jgi:hypothetical protein
MLHLFGTYIAWALQSIPCAHCSSGAVLPMTLCWQPLLHPWPLLQLAWLTPGMALH